MRLRGLQLRMLGPALRFALLQREGGGEAAGAEGDLVTGPDEDLEHGAGHLSAHLARSRLVRRRPGVDRRQHP